MEMEEQKMFVKYVKGSVDMNRICPMDTTEKLRVEVFMMYPLSLKRPRGNYFSFSCYNEKKSACLMPY